MDDLISRQAAIEALYDWSEHSMTDAEAWHIKQVIGDIKSLPSAQRTGRWKVSDLPKGKMKYCSECGFGQYIADERRYGFCPNCGADMRGEQDG